MIFLDDADVCVAGARDAGIHAVRYQDNAQAIAAIEELLTSSSAHLAGQTERTTSMRYPPSTTAATTA